MLRNGPLALMLILGTVMIFTATPYAGTVYFEGWDDGSLAGWRPVTAWTEVEVRNSGGNPDGYLYSYSDRNTTGAATELPEASGDWAARRIFRVSFDIMNVDSTITQGAFRVRFRDSRYNGWAYDLTNQHPVFPPDQWISFVIEFDPTWSDSDAIANGWSSDGPGTQSFAQTMSEVYQPQIRLIGFQLGTKKSGIDNFRLESSVIETTLDIKPGSCPNPLNVKVFERSPKNGKSKKGGVLPVAVLGTGDVDVSDIDVSTLLLEGVAPLRHDFVDVAAPVENGDECECTTEGPDGYVDLTLKFQRSEIVAALGSVSHGAVIPLTLTGELLDGTPLEVTDCVSILNKDPEPPTPFLFGDAGVVLRQPVPNPFNPITRISYALPKEDFVKLSVYDITGRLVEELVSEVRPAGGHVVEWNAHGMASGVYFYRIEVGECVQTKKMLLMK